MNLKNKKILIETLRYHWSMLSDISRQVVYMFPEACIVIGWELLHKFLHLPKTYVSVHVNIADFSFDLTSSHCLKDRFLLICSFLLFPMRNICKEMFCFCSKMLCVWRVRNINILIGTMSTVLNFINWLCHGNTLFTLVSSKHRLVCSHWLAQSTDSFYVHLWKKW